MGHYARPVGPTLGHVLPVVTVSLFKWLVLTGLITSWLIIHTWHIYDSLDHYALAITLNVALMTSHSIYNDDLDHHAHAITLSVALMTSHIHGWLAQCLSACLTRGIDRLDVLPGSMIAWVTAPISVWMFYPGQWLYSCIHAYNKTAFILFWLHGCFILFLT